ncbi:MAG TPA: CARDB domain-containing protein, partial [Dehalococcoidales bacterium]|nr:CARDB domain-containing protein [Dehalococcoidales bacterium]
YSINDNPGVPEAIKPILPGAALTVKLFANLGAGNHTLTLTADADNAVTEIDETNNGKTLSFSTIAPDLMVKSITWSPEKFAAGENVTITVEVENQGRTRAANTRVELRLGGASLGYAEIEEVVVGTPVKRNFIWTAVPGIHEINGIIDVDGLVLESNEANNTTITTLSLEVPVLSKKPTKISTAGAPDKGFLESSWWLILLAAAVLGGAAFYLALKAVRKS